MIAMRTQSGFRAASRPPCAAAPRQLWLRLKTALFPAYRPEHHYMRGPGPKWHEKHRPAARADRH
jgi:hypothetical protein